MGKVTFVTTQARKKPALHTLTLYALVAGGVLGVAAQTLIPGGAKQPVFKWILDNVITNVGNLFLTLIFMIVVPLLFSALVLGVSEIGEATKVGRIGIRSLVMTVVLSSIAVVLALVSVNLVKPWNVVSPETRQVMFAEVNKDEAAKRGAVAKEPDQDPPLLGMVPRNPLLEATRALGGGILPLMVFALIFGIAMTMVNSGQAAPVKGFLEGLFAISLKVVEMAMKLAPIGVFCLVFRTGALFGVEAFLALGKYAALVLVVLAIHQFGVYSLVLQFVAKISPFVFFRQMKTVMLTAFATSSSNATLPTALKAAQEDLGLPRDISSFVLTIGATANQNGTALFEGITIVFLCQLFGIDLNLAQQVQIMGLAILAGVVADGWCSGRGLANDWLNH
ncbi:MAG: dicarboxylate/amino acid:cation symporter [Fimbriimonadaceae bacterium]|nr:dicarboxylate/amino acid:cation symporter [Fimbriimonadaceae bacterium]